MSIPPTIAVTPSEALIDEPVRVIASGLAPAQWVRIETKFEDEAGVVWTASGLYCSDPHGVVDSDRCASYAGSYTGVEHDGLFYTALPAGAETAQAHWARSAADAAMRLDRPQEDSLRPRQYSVRAFIDEAPVATCAFTRHLTSPSVVSREIEEGGLRGVLYQPSTPGPHPAIIAIPGSLGGVDKHIGGYLASRGVAVLAIAYFNYPGVPSALRDIDLEYFSDAIRWLRREVGHDRIGVYGISYGSVAAMQTAVNFPDLVKALIAVVPSHVSMTGFQDNGAPGAPSWRVNGMPLPYATPKSDTLAAAIQAQREGSVEPYRSTPAFLESWNDPANLPAHIPIERAACPILALSAEGDGMWPSALAGEHLIMRLKQHNHPHPYTHICYPGAGHGLLTPGVPTAVMSRLYHSSMNFFIDRGGLPRETASAMTHMWTVILPFLRTHLAPP